MNKKKSRSVNEQPGYKTAMAWILACFVVMLPWISRVKLYEISEMQAKYFSNQLGISVDMFLYFKSIAVITMMIFLVCFFIGEHIFTDVVIYDIPLKEKQYRKILLAAGIYITMALISSVFSANRADTWMGSPTEFEGFWVLTGYMVLMLAGINYFRGEKAEKALQVGIGVLAAITVGLALLEFFRGFIFQIPFFQKMLSGSQYEELVSSLTTGTFKNMITLTFFNPNYFGSFCVLLFPVVVGITVKVEKLWMKLVLSILDGGLIIAVIGARSTAAFYILLVEMAALLFFLRKELWRRKKEFTAFVVITVSLLGSVQFLSKGKLLELAALGATNTTYKQEKAAPFKVEDIKMEQWAVTVVGKEQQFTITIDEKDYSNMSKMTFTNGQGNPISVNMQEDSVQFTEQGLEQIKLDFLEEGVSIDVGYEGTLDFYLTETGIYGVGQNGEQITSVVREHPIGEQYYSLFTGRGYTWFNSLPLLARHAAIGSGPGTFPYEFTQYDYVGLLKTHKTTKLMIDKPHNMYLQTGIQIGGISLLAMLFIFGWYLIKGRKTAAVNSLAAGLYIGCAGYMVIGLINDSMVVCAPVFWLLLGVGISTVREELHKG